MTITQWRPLVRRLGGNKELPKTDTVAGTFISANAYDGSTTPITLVPGELAIVTLPTVDLVLKLPSVPAVGTKCGLIIVSNSGHTCTVQRQSTDVFWDGSTSIALNRAGLVISWDYSFQGKWVPTTMVNMGFVNAVLSTDGTFAANSDGKLPSEKATTTYVAAQIATALSSVMHFRGVKDCSANPNYPAGIVGDSYMVSVAGKIGGASGVTVEVGDMIVCTIANAGGTQASVGADWDVVQTNLVGAITYGSTNPVTSTAIPMWNGTSGLSLVSSERLISVDGTMAGDSDFNLPSEKAIVTYVAAQVAVATAAAADAQVIAWMDL